MKNQTWTYQPTAGNHDYMVYDEATGKDVALVRDFNEENARLIAVAPELLAALEALYHYHYDGVDVQNMNFNSRIKELHLQGREAIAKAKGEY